MGCKNSRPPSLWDVRQSTFDALTFDALGAQVYERKRIVSVHHTYEVSRTKSQTCIKAFNKTGARMWCQWFSHACKMVLVHNNIWSTFLVFMVGGVNNDSIVYQMDDNGRMVKHWQRNDVAWCEDCHRNEFWTFTFADCGYLHTCTKHAFYFPIHTGTAQPDVGRTLKYCSSCEANSPNPSECLNTHTYNPA